MLGKAKEVAGVIEHMLATSIFNANFGNFYDIGCICGRQIKRREGSFTKVSGIVCPNTECRAIWDVVSEEGTSISFRRRRQQYVCPGFNQRSYVDSHLLKPGLIIKCECGARRSEPGNLCTGGIDPGLGGHSLIRLPVVVRWFGDTGPRI